MEIIVFIILFLIIMCIVIYNNLIRYGNLVNSAFSSICVILKKRYDLIPNLVDTVKGYMKYESDILEKLTEHRTQALNGIQSIDSEIKFDKDITSDMKQILILCESYPELKSSENFLKLQEALTNIENEISAARRTFNAAVTQYNINISIFPNNIFAGVFNFYEVSLFDTKDTENFKIELR